jgi:hypothetical protein
MKTMVSGFGMFSLIRQCEAEMAQDDDRAGERCPVGHLGLWRLSDRDFNDGEVSPQAKAEGQCARGEPRRIANNRTGDSAGRIWRSIAQVPVAARWTNEGGSAVRQATIAADPANDEACTVRQGAAAALASTIFGCSKWWRGVDVRVGGPGQAGCVVVRDQHIDRLPPVRRPLLGPDDALNSRDHSISTLPFTTTIAHTHTPMMSPHFSPPRCCIYSPKPPLAPSGPSCSPLPSACMLALCYLASLFHSLFNRLPNQLRGEFQCRAALWTLDPSIDLPKLVSFRGYQCI